MEIGEKIYKLRTGNGMTLEELGNKIGVGKSTVRKWEKGMIENMRRDKLAKLAAVFNVSPAWLMGLDEAKIEKIETERNDAENYIVQMDAETMKLAIELMNLDLNKNQRENIVEYAKFLKRKV